MMTLLFKKYYMKKEEFQKLKNTFKDMLIDVIDDFDPDGIVTNTIKHETGMGFSAYLEEKANDFIERLGD